jgi:hypothetical protein
VTTALVLHYSARFSSPDFIERAKDQRLTFEVQYEGAIMAVASGTLTLRNESNVAVLDGVAVQVASDGSVYYDLTAASVPTTEPISQRWLEDWALTFTDGQVHTFRRSAHLIKRRLYPCVTIAELARRHNDIRGLTSQSLQGYIDDAWDTLILRLIEDGRYPQQVMTPEGLIEAHKALTLSRAYLDMMLGEAGQGKYGDLATFYSNQYEAAWSRIRFTIDANEDNNPPGDDEIGQSEMPVIMLGGAPGTVERYR